ncbi:hypothetical protein C5F48_18580 [Cereibacter changlensis JA139]|uniref:Uncharacterized protein n=2 Tax=Cereibacter changlensis TaxID=402884 RepID=A0A2T4JQQ1_9RHOB|nr:hypothetical protein [Cereibacter changlensis]PTE20244.1 hypothetical protein C5F48_18580 [Cereibacter changlensis JA139]PZX47756.1 hypothetical protein LX76_04404 [Cereibacter changlensis]
MNAAVIITASFAAATALALGALLVGVLIRVLSGDLPRARRIGRLAFGFLVLQAALWALIGVQLGGGQ